MQAALPPLVSDAIVQTDDISSRDGSCQTDQPNEIDFPIQADLQSEMEVVSTIKEENMEVVFRIPTDDSSDDSSSDVSENNSEDKNSNDDVANSEVYKIYCQYKDPKNAIMEIEDLQNCLFIHEPQNNVDIEVGLKAIWRFFGQTTIPNKDFTPDLVSIKSFINGNSGYLEYGNIQDAFTMISRCSTTIKMIQPYGYEYWIVKDFEKGPEISKWYHGQAVEFWTAKKLAFLKLAGIGIPAVDERIRRWQVWTRFAERFIFDQGIIFIHMI